MCKDWCEATEEIPSEATNSCDKGSHVARGLRFGKLPPSLPLKRRNDLMIPCALAVSAAVRKCDLDRLQNLRNKAVNYEVERTKMNNFSFFLFRRGSPFLFVLSGLSGDDGFRVCEHQRGFIPLPE